MLLDIQQKTKYFVLNATLENHENLNHLTVLNFETCLEQYFGNGNFPKPELIAGLSDHHRQLFCRTDAVFAGLGHWSSRLPWEKNWPPWLLTVSSRWPKWSQPAVTEPWPGPWLSCDLAVTEPWSYWRCRDWAVTSLWPSRDWAVTSPSRDWAVIIGPRSRDHRGHDELTVSSWWPFIFSWAISKTAVLDEFFPYLAQMIIRTTRMPAFWDYPLPPHDYPYYWFILDLKSKHNKVKVTNAKNLPKFQI